MSVLVVDKIYDGTPDTTVSGVPALKDVIEGDDDQFVILRAEFEN